MRTTLDLNDQLLARAKARAVEEHTTLTRLIEQGLILRLREPESVASIDSLELPPPISGTGGLRPEVTNPASYAALLDLMDEDVPLDSRR
ncbi:MAG TPA: DUF2191 domain-containing protein [Chloroflexota bacterium]|nr:DUF2191 domain-containing protein [Chloroflexota bacterium]